MNILSIHYSMDAPLSLLTHPAMLTARDAFVCWYYAKDLPNIQRLIISSAISGWSWGTYRAFL